MSSPPASDAAPVRPDAVPPWTCPFCALHCDGFQPVQRAGRLTLEGSDCAVAQAGLQEADDDRAAGGVPAWVDGAPATLEDALAAATQRLVASRAPLFGGLATDIAGARALYALADATGAVLDAAGGEAQKTGLRALQDRGLLTTTLAEVRERADLLVSIGPWPTHRYPELLRRCGFEPLPPGRHRVAWDPAPLGLDAFSGLAGLNARLAGRPLQQPLPAASEDLVQRLASAAYAVLLFDLADAPAHGELIVEGLFRLAERLSRQRRAAVLLLGGGDGAQSVQQAVTWLSGLPLRTVVRREAPDHEPEAHAAPRLLARRAVDLCVWIGSFGGRAPLPDTDLPRIVLGTPGLVAQARRAGDIGIVVATPGIGAGGHLARFDSVVVLPLRALRDDGRPGVAAVLRRLDAGVRAAARSVA